MITIRQNKEAYKTSIIPSALCWYAYQIGDKWKLKGNSFLCKLLFMNSVASGSGQLQINFCVKICRNYSSKRVYPVFLEVSSVNNFLKELL